MKRTREELENAILRMQILKREGKPVDQIIYELETELFELCGNCDQKPEMVAAKADEEDNFIG